MTEFGGKAWTATMLASMVIIGMMVKWPERECLQALAALETIGARVRRVAVLALLGVCVVIGNGS